MLSNSVSTNPRYYFARPSSGPSVINQDDGALLVDVMVTVFDSDAQTFPFVPTSYQVVIHDLFGVPIDAAQVITTASQLDDMTMIWSCAHARRSNCEVLSRSGISVRPVDVGHNGTVLVDVIASAVNQPFQQAVLTGDAIVPFGAKATNPDDNFAMDSNLIFVHIVFKSGFENPKVGTTQRRVFRCAFVSVRTVPVDRKLLDGHERPGEQARSIDGEPQHAIGNEKECRTTRE